MYSLKGFDLRNVCLGDSVDVLLESSHRASIGNDSQPFLCRLSNDPLTFVSNRPVTQFIPICYSERKLVSNAVLMQRGDVVHLLTTSVIHTTQPNHDLFLLASLLASCYTIVSICHIAMIWRVVWAGGNVRGRAEPVGDGRDVPIALCNLDMPWSNTLAKLF
jgi:hypothetical protein